MLAFAAAAIFVLVASFTVSGHSQFDLPESNGLRALHDQTILAGAEQDFNLAAISQDSSNYNALAANSHLLKSKRKDDHDQVIKGKI